MTNCRIGQFVLRVNGLLAGTKYIHFRAKKDIKVESSQTKMASLPANNGPKGHTTIRARLFFLS